jgi:hypothetical protein
MRKVCPIAEHSIIGSSAVQSGNIGRGAPSLLAALELPAEIDMWRHLEPERLRLGAQGAHLLESESEHLVFCELCQELLILFEELARATSVQETKAA